MANYRFIVQYEALSGLPADRVINVLHATCANDGAAAAWAADYVTAWGTVLAGQTNGVTEYYGASISRVASAHKVLVYDLADVPPRVPVAEVPFTALTQEASDSMPTEVAVCLSFQAEPTSGQPQARRRGRIYVGPLTMLTGATDAGDGERRPSNPFVADLIIAAQEVLSSGNGVWCIYSPTDDLMHPVDNGWVDNAYDTQRRRGPGASSRTLWA